VELQFIATGRYMDRFEKTLRKGNYLFHIHTNWTDGQSSLSEYCAVAKEMGFQSIIVLEHVRRECTYDFQDFLRMVEEERVAHQIEILVGVEAKILPNGFVDVPEAILPHVQVLGIAEHSFQGKIAELSHALQLSFQHYQKIVPALVWVHPGLKLLKQLQAFKAFQETMKFALNVGAYIEVNLRYNLPPEPFLSQIPTYRLVIGVDAHSINEVKEFGKAILDLENKIAKKDSSRI